MSRLLARVRHAAMAWVSLLARGNADIEQTSPAGPALTLTSHSLRVSRSAIGMNYNVCMVDWSSCDGYFIIGLPADVGVCAAGEIAIVNQALKPAARCSSANSA